MPTVLNRAPAAIAAMLTAWAAPEAAAAGSLPAGSSKAVAVLRAAGPGTTGNAEAAAAWRELASLEPAHLPDVLGAMDGAGELAANWFRPAAEALADRALVSGARLPVGALGAFLLDSRHDAAGRRLALDLIARVEPDAAALLLPGLLHDPAPDLRREAVQQLALRADAELAAAHTNTAVLLYAQAVSAAREGDQIESLDAKLRALGQPVDLADMFQWITRWRVVGPFDNTGGSGFERAYSPESAADAAGEYDGRTGRVKWQPLVSTNEFGVVDLNQPYGKLKEVAGYAVAEVIADRPQPVELRLGSQNAWKIWLNGRFLFGRDEYHRGRELDQYRIPTQLQAGTNTIIVKVCQNEQREEWTEEWQFSLRLTDPAGAPVAVKQR